MGSEKRLIDANAFEEKLICEINKSGKYGAYECALDDAVLYLSKAPTVDAVEVVHGEWDVITDDCTFDAIYQCSVCKEEFVTNDGTPAENLWHYCPNCGAKMDGGNEDG